MVTERDKALRSAVLGTLAVLYQQEGEATVWAQCGRLSDQQTSLIEVRKHLSPPLLLCCLQLLSISSCACGRWER